MRKLSSKKIWGFQIRQVVDVDATQVYPTDVTGWQEMHNDTRGISKGSGFSDMAGGCPTPLLFVKPTGEIWMSCVASQLSEYSWKSLLQEPESLTTWPLVCQWIYYFEESDHWMTTLSIRGVAQSGLSRLRLWLIAPVYVVNRTSVLASEGNCSYAESSNSCGQISCCITWEIQCWDLLHHPVGDVDKHVNGHCWASMQ